MGANRNAERLHGSSACMLASDEQSQAVSGLPHHTGGIVFLISIVCDRRNCKVTLLALFVMPKRIKKSKSKKPPGKFFIRVQNRSPIRPGVRAFVGKGGYWDDFKKWSNTDYGKMWMNFGNDALARSPLPFAPFLGQVARGMRGWLGLGSYRPAGGGVLQASPVPRMHSMLDKGVRIQHSEYFVTLVPQQRSPIPRFQSTRV